MPVLQSGDSFSTAVSLGDAAKRCAERTKDEVTAGTAYVPPPRPKPKAPPPAPKLGHDEERQMEEEAAKEAGWETVTGMARGSNNVMSNRDTVAKQKGVEHRGEQKWPTRSILHANDAPGSHTKRIMRPPAADTGLSRRSSKEGPTPHVIHAAAPLKGTVHTLDVLHSRPSVALPKLNLTDILPKPSSRGVPRVLAVPHPPENGIRYMGGHRGSGSAVMGHQTDRGARRPGKIDVGGDGGGAVNGWTPATTVADGVGWKLSRGPSTAKSRFSKELSRGPSTARARVNGYDVFGFVGLRDDVGVGVGVGHGGGKEKKMAGSISARGQSEGVMSVKSARGKLERVGAEIKGDGDEQHAMDDAGREPTTVDFQRVLSHNKVRFLGAGEQRADGQERRGCTGGEEEEGGEEEDDNYGGASSGAGGVRRTSPFVALYDPSGAGGHLSAGGSASAVSSRGGVNISRGGAESGRRSGSNSLDRAGSGVSLREWRGMSRESKSGLDAGLGNPKTPPDFPLSLPMSAPGVSRDCRPAPSPREASAPGAPRERRRPPSLGKQAPATAKSDSGGRERGSKPLSRSVAVVGGGSRRVGEEEEGGGGAGGDGVVHEGKGGNAERNGGGSGEDVGTNDDKLPIPVPVLKVDFPQGYGARPKNDRRGTMDSFTARGVIRKVGAGAFAKPPKEGSIAAREEEGREEVVEKGADDVVVALDDGKVQDIEIYYEEGEPDAPLNSGDAPIRFPSDAPLRLRDAPPPDSGRDDAPVHHESQLAPRPVVERAQRTAPQAPNYVLQGRRRSMDDIVLEQEAAPISGADSIPPTPLGPAISGWRSKKRQHDQATMMMPQGRTARPHTDNAARGEADKPKMGMTPRQQQIMRDQVVAGAGARLSSVVRVDTADPATVSTAATPRLFAPMSKKNTRKQTSSAATAVPFTAADAQPDGAARESSDQRRTRARLRALKKLEDRARAESGGVDVQVLTDFSGGMHMPVRDGGDLARFPTPPKPESPLTYRKTRVYDTGLRMPKADNASGGEDGEGGDDDKGVIWEKEVVRLVIRRERVIEGLRAALRGGVAMGIATPPVEERARVCGALLALRELSLGIVETHELWRGEVGMEVGGLEWDGRDVINSIISDLAWLDDCAYVTATLSVYGSDGPFLTPRDEPVQSSRMHPIFGKGSDPGPKIQEEVNVASPSPLDSLRILAAVDLLERRNEKGGGASAPTTAPVHGGGGPSPRRRGENSFRHAAGPSPSSTAASSPRHGKGQYAIYADSSSVDGSPEREMVPAWSGGGSSFGVSRGASSVVGMSRDPSVATTGRDRFLSAQSAQMGKAVSRDSTTGRKSTGGGALMEQDDVQDTSISSLKEWEVTSSPRGSDILPRASMAGYEPREKSAGKVSFNLGESSPSRGEGSGLPPFQRPWKDMTAATERGGEHGGGQKEEGGGEEGYSHGEVVVSGHDVQFAGDWEGGLREGEGEEWQAPEGTSGWMPGEEGRIAKETLVHIYRGLLQASGRGSKGLSVLDLLHGFDGLAIRPPEKELQAKFSQYARSGPDTDPRIQFNAFVEMHSAYERLVAAYKHKNRMKSDPSLASLSLQGRKRPGATELISHLIGAKDVYPTGEHAVDDYEDWFDGDAADKVAFIDKTTKMREGEKAASEKKKFDSMLSDRLERSPSSSSPLATRSESKSGQNESSRGRLGGEKSPVDNRGERSSPEPDADTIDESPRGGGEGEEERRYQQLQQARASLERRIEGYKDKKRVAGMSQGEAHKRVERGRGGKGVREGGGAMITVSGVGKEAIKFVVPVDDANVGDATVGGGDAVAAVFAQEKGGNLDW